MSSSSSSNLSGTTEPRENMTTKDLLAEIPKPPKYCETCSKREEDEKDTKNKLKFCSGCRRVFYCSTHCQKNDWTSHRTFCKKRSLHTMLVDHVQKRKDSKKALTGLFRQCSQILKPTTTDSQEWEKLYKVASVFKIVGKLTGRSTTKGTDFLNEALNCLIVCLAISSDLQQKRVYRKLGKMLRLLGDTTASLHHFTESLCAPEDLSSGQTFEDKSLGKHTIHTLFRICKSVENRSHKQEILKNIHTIVRSCTNQKNREGFLWKLFRYHISLFENARTYDEMTTQLDIIADEIEQDFCICNDDFSKVSYKVFLYEKNFEKALPRAKEYLESLIRKHKRKQQLQVRLQLRKILNDMGRPEEAAKNEVHIQVLTKELQTDEEKKEVVTNLASEKAVQKSKSIALWCLNKSRGKRRTLPKKKYSTVRH